MNQFPLVMMICLLPFAGDDRCDYQAFLTENMEGEEMAKTITRRQFLTAEGALGAAMMLAGCSTDAPSGGDEGGIGHLDPADMKIEMISTAPGEVTAMQIDVMAAYAAEHGVGDFRGEYYDTNVAKEAELIENAVQRGVHCIIIFNQNDIDCADSMNAAVEAGVLVMLYLTKVDCNYTLFVGEDSYAAGQVQGELAGNWARENLVAQGKDVNFAASTFSISSPAIQRFEGCRDKFMELVPEANFVGSFEAAYREAGIEMGEDILQTHPEVNVITTVSDDPCIGVVEAYRAAGKTGDDVAIFGLDGIPVILREVEKNDLVKGTVETPTNGAGIELLQAAIDILSGNSDLDVAARTERIWDNTPITIDDLDKYEELLNYHYEG